MLLSLDGFNHQAMTPELTSRLWALGEAGGRAPDGGRCDLPSVTYPSHATILTGCATGTHRVRSNLAAAPRAGTVPGWAGERRVAVPTLFDACRAAGLRSAAILGDHKLSSILGVETADDRWPRNGTPDADTALDAFGYATNAAVRPHLLAAAADAGLPFLFGHLNETDTWGHRLGPDHPETLACYAATDAIVGEVRDALAADWSRTVLIVLSDHGMEPMVDAPAVDLVAAAAGGTFIAEVVDEGGAALVRLLPGVDAARAGAAVATVPGVAGWRQIEANVLLVEAEAGRLFSRRGTKSLRGVHGGPGTQRTTAVVAGGHAAVPAIAAAMNGRPPHGADWAPTIAGLRGLEMPGTEGRNLLIPETNGGALEATFGR